MQNSKESSGFDWPLARMFPIKPKREATERRRKKSLEEIQSVDDLVRGDKVVSWRWGIGKESSPIYRHRQGPVPYIYGGFGGGGSYYRSPRCKAALVAKEILRGETEPPARKREVRTNYDDIPREKQRSWKKHRKTRWKTA